jgi:phosphoenolpyruvate carboxykinase (ATP)
MRKVEDIGLREGHRLHRNLSEAALFELAVRRNEGLVANGGGLAVATAPHTGRAPNDKFIVRDAATEASIWWENSQALAPEHFTRLEADFMAAAAERDLFIQDLHAGADPAYRLPVRIICEYAWHSLFIRHLMIRGRSHHGDFSPRLTIIDLPSFRADPKTHGVRSPVVIACNFSKGLVLIGGTSYAGEMKKSVFTLLNFLLPESGVMPMHCSANTGPRDDVALFFGLSGTGKTTLSADPGRTLIGDDEHGWSDQGVFNFEGGCYAKVIRLAQQAEPQIFAATHRFASILENVAIDTGTREIDLDDSSLTENTRAAYPLDYIPNASTSGVAGHPRNIIMLTADAFGVMPPIARLSPEQAMYHFLSGYTAKVAGTEQGVKEPEATFSACFGAPFMPRHPARYGELLGKRISEHKVSCWMVNTGWTGGPYGIGKRMPIEITRRLLSQSLEGRLEAVPKRRDPWFGFEVPTEVPGVDPQILTPRETWSDADAFAAQARRLARLFVKNFEPLGSHVSKEVRAARPVTD